MTEREYRTAKQLLEKRHFATFRTTNRGTIATLIDTRIFDVNLELGDGQHVTRPTDRRQAGDRQATTTNNERTAKNGEEAAPRMYPREQDKRISDLKAELKKLSPSDSDKIGAILSKLWPLEEKKYGCQRTSRPRPKPQPPRPAVTVGRLPDDIPHPEWKLQCDKIRQAVDSGGVDNPSTPPGPGATGPNPDPGKQT
jgi:hypothetical protein